MLDFYYLHICLKMGGFWTKLREAGKTVGCTAGPWILSHGWRPVSDTSQPCDKAWTSALLPLKWSEKGTGQSLISLSANRPWFQTARFHRYIQYFAVFLDRDSFLPTWQRQSSQMPGETGAGSCWGPASMAQAGSTWKSPRPHSWSKHSASVTFESTFPTWRPTLWVNYSIHSNAGSITYISDFKSDRRDFYHRMTNRSRKSLSVSLLLFSIFRWRYT